MKSMRIVRAMLPLSRVVQWDSKGRPNKIIVPGSDSKRYTVIIRRQAEQYLECECKLDVTGTSDVDCPGNAHNVCYHAQAAVMKCLEEAGFKYAAFCKTLPDAQRLAHLVEDGDIYRVVSRQSRKSRYLVYGKHLKGTKR